MMFETCTALESIDLSDFVTDKVETMCGMFRGCESLTSLDLSNFETKNVTDMSKMFSDYTPANSYDTYHSTIKLISITVSDKWKYAADTTDMFQNCGTNGVLLNGTLMQP